jgi:hypothetical protein
VPCDRQIAGDRKVLVGIWGDGGRDEGNRGVAGDVEEVGRGQMAVALGVARVKAFGLDGQLGLSTLGFDVELPAEAFEMSVDRRKPPHRLDGELEAAGGFGVPYPDRQSEIRWCVWALGAHGASLCSGGL